LSDKSEKCANIKSRFSVHIETVNQFGILQYIYSNNC